MGIDRVAVKLYAYVIGAIFGGVAGCFFAAKMTAFGLLAIDRRFH